MAAFQVPEILLLDINGSAGAAAPLQIGATALKTGTSFANIVIAIVVLEAHSPAEGVKV